jgi:ferric-dicitrate binding protein FerR (iron transport regulator)
MKHQNMPQDKHDEFEKFVASRANMTEEEQKLEAGLLIERIDSINTNKAYGKVQNRMNIKALETRWIQNLQKYAAILILPLFLALSYSIYLNFTPKKQETVSYELTCPIGIRTQAVLPDGTKVWLNAKSSIKYQLPFVQHERNIKLSGEAFFEVTKNQKSPFIIESQNSFVKVLGTKFNVRSYPEDEEIAVALEEGSVDFTATNSENKTIQSVLKPNEYLVYTKADKSLSVTSENIGKFISWRQNRMVLDETPIRDVAVLLSRWYGVQVEVVDQEILNYKFTTTFENESLSQVLELLEISSPVRIKYVPVKSDSGTEGNLSAKVYFYKK